MINTEKMNEREREDCVSSPQMNMEILFAPKEWESVFTPAMTEHFCFFQKDSELLFTRQ